MDLPLLVLFLIIMLLTRIPDISMKKIPAIFALFCLSGWCHAGLSTVYNPWTGKPDYISSGTTGGGNFINNTSTLQSAATFYVSSGTITSPYVVGGGSITSNGPVLGTMYFSYPAFNGDFRFNFSDNGIGNRWIQFDPGSFKFYNHFAGAGDLNWIISDYDDTGHVEFVHYLTPHYFFFYPSGSGSPAVTISSVTTAIYGSISMQGTGPLTFSSPNGITMSTGVTFSPIAQP